MDTKGIYECQIIENSKIATGVYDMLIEAEDIASQAKPGQFVFLYAPDEAHLMPRPISLCKIDKDKGTLRLVYRVVGYGTDYFSKLTSDDKIRVMGPLGNGFVPEGEKALIVGGGIGIPPMLGLSEYIYNSSISENSQINVVLGYRDNELFLKEEFDEYANVHIATDDGSVGIKGTVIDVLKEKDIEFDTIYACGPTPMLRALSQYAKENGKKAYISLEEKMACGIGACLGCVCKSTEVDQHTHVHNKRVCKDGPVFLSTEVEL